MPPTMNRDLFAWLAEQDEEAPPPAYYAAQTEEFDEEAGELVLVGSLDATRSAEQAYDRERAERAKGLATLPRFRVALDEGAGQRKIGGDERVENFYGAIKRFNAYSIEENGFPIPAMHLKIVETMLSSLLEKIYGEDYERNIVRLLRKFHKDMFRSACFVCLPRRYGKTYITALVVAAYLYTQPGAAINVYSISRRTSSMFAMLVISDLLILGATRFPTKNVEIVEVENMYPGMGPLSRSTLRSYPASEEVSRSVRLWSGRDLLGRPLGPGTFSFASQLCPPRDDAGRLLCTIAPRTPPKKIRICTHLSGLKWNRVC